MDRLYTNLSATYSYHAAYSGPTNTSDDQPPDLVYRSIDRQMTMRIRRPRLVIDARREAPIIIRHLALAQQCLLLFPRSRKSQCFTDTLRALPSHRPSLDHLRPLRRLHHCDMAHIGAICLVGERPPILQDGRSCGRTEIWCVTHSCCDGRSSWLLSKGYPWRGSSAF